jgi:uncharacterized membrane protein
MNKKEFLDELKSSLKQFNDKEIEGVINYYDEMINDKMESGENEELIIESLGSIKNIKAQISADLINVRLKENENKTNLVKTSNNFFIILMLFIASPALLPIGIAFFAVFFSLLITMFALVISFAAASISLIIALIPALFVSFQSTGIGGVIVSVGAILFLIGFFAILSIICTNIGLKFLNLIIKAGSQLINKTFKRGNKNEI